MLYCVNRLWAEDVEVSQGAFQNSDYEQRKPSYGDLFSGDLYFSNFTLIWTLPRKITYSKKCCEFFWRILLHPYNVMLASQFQMDIYFVFFDYMAPLILKIVFPFNKQPRGMNAAAAIYFTLCWLQRRELYGLKYLSIYLPPFPVKKEERAEKIFEKKKERYQHRKSFPYFCSYKESCYRSVLFWIMDYWLNLAVLTLKERGLL